MIDIRTCNGRVATGCATPRRRRAATPLNALVDPTTRTLYVTLLGESGVSVLDAAPAMP